MVRIGSNVAVIEDGLPNYEEIGKIEEFIGDKALVELPNRQRIIALEKLFEVQSTPKYKIER